MTSALEILPLTDAVLHIAIGISGTIFAMMLVGGVFKRIAYNRGHGDVAHRLSAEKTIFHSALVLLILVFLWIMLFVTNILDSQSEKKVFGIFEQNSNPQNEYQLKF
jgi:hypothetical protein